ncbi:MAG: hypothetical protein WA709_39270 [Stellaceae bacterium]
MRASPNDGLAVDRLIPIIFAGWIVLMPVLSAAQQPGPPIPLIPPPSVNSPYLSPSPSSHDDAVASEPLAPPAGGWDSGTPFARDTLPEALWRGTSRKMADVLLALLPDTTSPELQSLEPRLLLSGGAAPEGPEAGDHRLPALRASALLRLGELDAARAVIAAISQLERGPALPLAVAADAIGGDTRRACSTVREMVRRDEAPFWQTALIACQALQGEVEQARLALCLALDEEAPAATRLTAAERAARYGALSPDRLRALYSTLSVGGHPGEAGALDHARLFAAIAEAGTLAERMKRIAGFTDAFGSRQGDGFALAARLLLPALREIDPDPTLAGSAPLATRLLIAAGDIPAARRWGGLASGDKQRSLRFLLALAAPREELALDQEDAPRPLLFLILTSALGEPVPAADLAALPAAAWTAAGPPSPPPAAWLDLAEATAGKRIGETGLAAIIVASQRGTLSTDPVALYTAVSSLNRVGLRADARRLAVEAALAGGL